MLIGALAELCCLQSISSSANAMPMQQNTVQSSMGVNRNIPAHHLSPKSECSSLSQSSQTDRVPPSSLGSVLISISAAC